jgi:hypothetical protein
MIVDLPMSFISSSVALMREYDGILQHFLERIQKEHPNLISETDDIQANYGLSRTFRRTAEGRARAANRDSGVQNEMNRWKKIEQANGRCPRFNMVDHYSHARYLMHVTWIYSFVQLEESDS